MIKTELNREDALKILEIGQRLHQESHFRDEPFDAERCWAVLQNTLAQPNKYFIAYDDQYRGFILMARTEHFFSGEVSIQDLSFYVAPEARGSSIAVKLEAKAREWGQQIGASDMVIYHNTGIDKDKAPELFKKLGYDMKGYIFSREI